MPIVVGYSEKPEGRAAIERAVIEAQMRNLKLLIVPNSAADDLSLAEELLGTSGREYEFAPAPTEGDVGEHLLEMADRYQAELIIIGLRRRSPTGKLLLGMNAQRVLLDAGSPVLAVKATG